MVTFISAVVLAGTLLKPEFVECHLWKRVTDKSGQRMCVYRGKNGTFGYHYVTESGGVNDWAQCPKMFMCRYSPKDKRPTIGDIMDSLTEEFSE